MPQAPNGNELKAIGDAWHRFCHKSGPLSRSNTKFHYHIEWFSVARLFDCLKTKQKAEIGVKMQFQ